jgi:hypothetical protein
VLGERTAAQILAWADSDGYTASADVVHVPSGAPGAWVPTPPAYSTALEPGWGSIRTFVVRPDDCQLGAPVAYSDDPASDFYEQAMSVYRADRDLTDEQREIARFWNMEPNTGTPAGHWTRILNTVSADLDLSLAEAVEAHAAMSVAVADSFVLGWGEKFTTDVLRPVTFIRDHIDPDWLPYLVTPQFPEYPSGHSFSSGAAAAVLTAMFDDREFVDSSNHDGVTRHFDSFEDAAREAASSRLYGGVHYPMGIDRGHRYGDCIGHAAVERLQPGGDR